MKRILLFLLLACAGWLPVFAQQGQVDSTVFGFRLGSPFVVKECACKVVEYKANPYSSGVFAKKVSSYQYAEFAPATGFCFQRKNISQYTAKKKTQLDSLPPITNETVEVVFSNNDAPSMCPTGRFDAVVKDGKLQAIMFTIRTQDANKDFAILKNKYGPNVNVQNYKMQNGYGASVDYFEAVWGLPNLTVAMTSSLHRMLNDAFGQVTIGLPVPQQKHEDKRPL